MSVSKESIPGRLTSTLHGERRQPKRHGPQLSRPLALLICVALAIPLGAAPSESAHGSGASSHLGVLDQVRVSVHSDGTEGDGDSYNPSISADGRYVAFQSHAANLVDNDTNARNDVFVHDRDTGVTERVSVDSDGAEGDGHSYNPSISADGRYVAFESEATNLVAGDTNGSRDVFVHDRDTGVTERVSVDSDGAEGDGDSYFSSISANGRYVAFGSAATNLVAGDTNSTTDVFVHDRDTGVTERVSVDSDGAESDGYSNNPSITADGRYVAFGSAATNLVAGDTNARNDVFVHDRDTGVTERVSVHSDGTEGDSHSWQPSITADGRYVAFESDAANLVAGDTNGSRDVFVHDRDTGVTERVSARSDGTEGNCDSYNPSITADGRYVAFESDAANLVAGDTNSARDVFVHDRDTGVTERVSTRSDGTEGNGDSSSSSISADGRRVAFESRATNLVDNDTNARWDIFVADLMLPAVTKRLDGRTRFSTAVAIAKEGFPDWEGVTDVVIASGDDRAAADPLAASGLCWAYDAPMLLVSAARTPDEVKAAIAQIVAANGPVTLRVVGGPVSVPDARLNEIKAHAGPANVTVDRILATGGRYDLSRAIALRMRSVAAADPEKTMPSVALVANGADATKFFDALALSPISAGTGAPILLVTYDTVPGATASALNTLKPTTTIVGGGPMTVSNAVLTQLGATRWSGRTRYDTAIAIANGAVSEGWLSRKAVGVAAVLPDALTGGAFIGLEGGVLVLTDGSSLTPATRSWLVSHKTQVHAAYIFGGPNSVKPGVKTQIVNALE